MFIKGLDFEKVMLGLATQPLGICPFCRKPIVPGHSIAVQETVFTSHEKCFRHFAQRQDRAHECAHALSTELLKCVDKFVGANGGDAKVPMTTVLAGVEQLASVWRRFAAASKLPREEAVAIQVEATECSKGIARYMLNHSGDIPSAALAHRDNTNSLDASTEAPTSPVSAPVATRQALGRAFGSMTTRALSGSWTGEPEEV
jgi:hypothetical protein